MSLKVGVKRNRFFRLDLPKTFSLRNTSILLEKKAVLIILLKATEAYLLYVKNFTSTCNGSKKIVEVYFVFFIC